MAVYERRYRSYEGPESPPRTRFMILARYGIERLFESKWFVVFMLICMLFPLGMAVTIYGANHLDLIEKIGIHVSQGSVVEIGPSWFLTFLYVQGLILGFLMLIQIGPALVSPDLSNNALPLYLSRPFSKWEYALGKGMLIALLMSLITWVPGLLLFAMQAAMAGWGWFASHWTIAPALAIGSLALIVVYALLALAVSATLKWRPVAAGVLTAIWLFGTPFSWAIDASLNTKWGGVLDLKHLFKMVWQPLFGVTIPVNAVVPELSPTVCWLALFALCAVCLRQISRRLRAYEVVR